MRKDCHEATINLQRMRGREELHVCAAATAQVHGVFVFQVLLFSTMTRLLDIVEEHLECLGLVSVRLDGATASEERGAVRLTLCVGRGAYHRRKACMYMCMHMERWDSCCACSACRASGCSSGGGAV